MNRANPSILVVDDEQEACRNLYDILTDLGYDVATAYDGPAALELVRRKRYDVALLDLMMPGMNGLTLYREIKRARAETVALIVTAYPNSPDADEAVAMGAWQVVPKPVEIPQLLSLVNAALTHPLVLVIDDDCDLCANLWDLLREQGYRVGLAHDQAAAAAHLAGCEFDIILLDMRLPHSSGEAVFRLARQADPNARVIIITGYRAQEEPRVRQLLSEGAEGVFEKPFDVPKLLATLRQLAGA